MLCAAIDIGSNTTRVLVAEPQDGQLRKVMEQRAYTRIDKASQHDGAIDQAKIDEVADVVATQVRLAQEVGAEAIRTVATAAIREAANRDEIIAEINRVANVDVDVLSEHEEGRLAFIGATKTLHPDFGTFWLGAPIGIPWVRYLGFSRSSPSTFSTRPRATRGRTRFPTMRRSKAVRRATATGT